MSIGTASIQSGFTDPTEFQKGSGVSGWISGRRFQKQAEQYEGGCMTSIIFYRDNIRKFVEDAADGRVSLRSRSEDSAAHSGAVEPEGSGTAWHSFLWIRCNGRKGVDMHSTVPKKTAENNKK
jgi:hypothetical protein